ncbi:hypothetical protein BIU90_13570 [Curtobacterium sp. MCBA15_001]|nr:hypothetical protein BIU90_13570 [Curtobacterium sp. MCBA15_001]
MVDALWLPDGPPSGRMVVREMVAAWLREHPGDDLVLVVHDQHVADVAAEFTSATVVGTSLRLHPLVNAVTLPRVARRSGADLVVTQNFAPLSKRVPSAVFVHDVLFQTNPRWFTRSERLYLSLIPMLLTRATTVMTSSANEANRILAHNPGVSAVDPVGLGIAAALTGRAPAEPVDGLIPDRFLLAVGRLNVRKNLATTIEAAVGSGAATVERPLIVVGEASGREEHLSEAVLASVASGSVQFLGGVSDAQLRWLYEHCRLFVFMSLDEGWGLPPIEAVSLGAPVLVSDRPVFRETLGAAATYAPPRDVAEIGRTMMTLLTAARRTQTALPPERTSWTRLVETAREAAAS